MLKSQQRGTLTASSLSSSSLSTSGEGEEKHFIEKIAEIFRAFSQARDTEVKESLYDPEILQSILTLNVHY